MKKPARKKAVAHLHRLAVIRPGFLQDALCDRIAAAIRFGLFKAFKHRDDSLTEEQEGVICASILQEVENTIHDALDFGEHN